jgi:hypothetical protein
MFLNENKVSIGIAKVLRTLLIPLAAVFVMSLAMASTAQGFSITGKVVAIDTGQKTISVAAYYGPNYPLSYRGGADRLNTFALKRGAEVMKGSTKLDFGDIRVGDWVTINYYEKGDGLAVADGIAITTPPAPYLGETAKTFSIPGKVVAIDRDARTFTVDPSYYYGPAREGTKTVRVFAAEPGLVVMMGNEPRDFKDISVGDWVTVNFHREGSGLAVADGIAITAPPAPYLGETSQMFSIPGKVVAMDRDARTFTIDPSYCYTANYGGKGLQTFALDRGTVVMMGNEPKNFRDIRVGDWVTVNFHRESNGGVITDGIAFTSPAVISCPEKQG